MESTIRSLFAGQTLGWKKFRALCGLQNCYNRLLLGRMPNLHRGIMLDGVWYCSVACFAAGAGSRIAALSNARIMQREHRPRLSVTLVLVAKGYLAETQLRSISDEAKSKGESPEEVILRRGLATEKQMASARAAQWGCAALGLDHVAAPIAVDLPLELLRACSAVPLHYARDRRQLLLGFVQRPHYDLLQAVENVTGCRPDLCLITEEEFHQQFNLLGPPTDYICESGVQNITAMRAGRALAAHALDIGAEEARFSLCRNAVWMRVKGRRGIRDMVIPSKGVHECELGRPDAMLSSARLEQLPPAADSTPTRWQNATRDLFRRLRIEPYSGDRGRATIRM